MNKSKNPKNKIFKNMSKILDIPQEIVTLETTVFITKNNKIEINGYKQIEDFNNLSILIRGIDIRIQIIGKNLDIYEMLDSKITIEGEVEEVIYLK